MNACSLCSCKTERVHRTLLCGCPEGESLKSRDSAGNEVLVGDSIRVLEIDKRITEFIPEDEKSDLALFIGEVFEVEKVNSDGSMLVSKSWHSPEIGEIRGHGVAIFPKGALLVRSHNKKMHGDERVI